MKFKVSKATIIRTIMTALVIINMILEKFSIDIINTHNNTVFATLELIIQVGIIICAWWYNNSFSMAAKKADRFYMAVKEYEAQEKNK